MRINIEWNRIDAEIDRATEEMMRRLERGVEMAAFRVENAARDLCPVDTGNMRDHITHVTARDGNRVQAAVGVAIGGLGADLGSEAGMNYPIFVHEGTGEYSRTGMGSTKPPPWWSRAADGTWQMHWPIRPNPFLENAYLQEQNECAADIAAWLTRGG